MATFWRGSCKNFQSCLWQPKPDVSPRRSRHLQLSLWRPKQVFNTKLWCLPNRYPFVVPKPNQTNQAQCWDKREIEMFCFSPLCCPLVTSLFSWPQPHAKLPDVRNNRIIDIFMCGGVYCGVFFSPVRSFLMSTVMIRPRDSFCMPNLCILLRMTTVSKCATFFIRAHLSMRDAIKEHHKASYKFLRELITKAPSGSFCAFVFWFCNAKRNASLSQKKCAATSWWCEKPRLTLSSFISFILHSYFQDD